MLDLFCGAGGLAMGFRKAGFHVTGADISAAAGETFRLNAGGEFIRADLSRELISGDFPDGLGLTPRYQMVADAVSPAFSRALALAIREWMDRDGA